MTQWNWKRKYFMGLALLTPNTPLLSPILFFHHAATSWGIYIQKNPLGHTYIAFNSFSKNILHGIAEYKRKWHSIESKSTGLELKNLSSSPNSAAGHFYSQVSYATIQVFCILTFSSTRITAQTTSQNCYEYQIRQCMLFHKLESV